MRSLLCLALLYVAFGAYVPYFEDFENGPGGWTTGVVNGTVNDWALGRSTKTNFVGAYSGNFSWVTGLTAAYRNNQNSYVQSPDFSFENVSSTAFVFFRLRFSFEGTTTFYDGLRMEYGVNGTWTILGALGDYSWYNAQVVTSSARPGWGGSSQSYQTNYTFVGHVLPASLYGQPLVQFRFVFTSDYINGAPGASIDDFQVTLAPAPDCPAIVSPSNGANVDPLVQLLWTPPAGEISWYDLYIGNSSTPSKYQQIPANATSFEVYPGPGTFYYQLVSQYYGARSNCEVRSAVNALRPVPYFNDFESGGDGWSSTALFSRFVLGTPSKLVINRAYSGANAWVTCGLTGTYPNSERAQLRTPYFDFTRVSLNVSTVSFALWYHTEPTYDGVNIQYTDNGDTWTTLGTRGDPTNWYTDLSLSSLGSQPAWTGTRGDYVIVSRVLPLALRNRVLAFRVNFGADSSGNNYSGAALDNFAIAVTPPSPASCATYTAPANNSIPYNPTTLRWQSSDPETTGFRVYLSSDPLFSNPTITDVALATSFPLQLLTPGTYYWKIVPYGAVGANLGCPSSSFVISDVITNIPYFEDFENGPMGWTTRSLASNNIVSWALGAPNKTAIRGAFSGVNAWVTGLRSNYQAYEVSAVESPIFDLRGVARDPTFAFRINYDLESYDGAIVQVATGGSSWRTVGNNTSPSGVSWYNNSVSVVQNQGFGSFAWSGNSTGNYVLASHELTGTAGSLIRVRVVLIADFSIQQGGLAFDDVWVINAGVPTSTRTAPTITVATSARPSSEGTTAATTAATFAATSNTATSNAVSNMATSNAASNMATSNSAANTATSNAATSAPSRTRTSAPTISNPITIPVTLPPPLTQAVSGSFKLKLSIAAVAVLVAALL